MIYFSKMRRVLLSKYQQIDIRLLPIYGSGGLRGAFPNFYKLLDDSGYTLVIQKEPSLYEMVDVLVRIGNDPHVPGAAKGAITERVGEFTKLRDEARELLLSRRLNELDRVLFRLEDMFGDLENRL
jgi:hypothetical protein